MSACLMEKSLMLESVVTSHLEVVQNLNQLD